MIIIMQRLAVILFKKFEQNTWAINSRVLVKMYIVESN